MKKLFGGAKPEHPMADPKEARRLLEELTSQEPLKALEDLAHWHESVGIAEGFRPEARIQLLFAIDEAAQDSVRRAARDYLSAARPSRFQENRIWTRIHDYCAQCGRAYALSVDTVLQGARGADAARPLLPLLVVRTLRALSQQIKWLHLRYGPMDPAIWRVLNGVYAFAEAQGIADTRVPAVYPGVTGESTPRQEFIRALMLNVSSPDSLLPSEIELAERVIGDFAASLLLVGEGGPDLTHWTDLGEAMAPLRLAKTPQRTPGLRFLGAGSALGALEALIRRIEATGQLPASVTATGNFESETVVEVMRHLLLYWSSAAPERKHPRHAVKSRLSIVHGFDGVVGALNGAGAAPDSGKQAADKQGADKHGPENWIVENVSAGGFGAVVPQAKSDWLKIGALLAMQPDGGNNWVVGMVRRVTKVSAQEARVGIQTLSRTPQLAQFALRGAARREPEPGVLLPASGLGSGEASIALRTGVFVPGQTLENQRGGRSYVYMPQDLAERGDDYDIVRFREMVRES
jgi:hypothetical protein